MKKITSVLIIALSFIATNTFAQNDFITTWQTTTPNENITISTVTPGYYNIYNYDVDWNNDGVYDDINVEGDITHTFPTAGVHTISINGGGYPKLFPQIQVIPTMKNKILSIEQWGNIQWDSMEFAFAGCSNLQINATDSPNLNYTFSMYGMFSDCTTLNADINHWDVSKVSEMNRLFENASSFNQNIGDWDISNVRYTNGVQFGLGYILRGTALSVENYDAILNGWSTLDPDETEIPTNLPLIMGNIKYCAGASARHELITNKSWSISDGGIDCQTVGKFITTWQTTTPNETITIPTSSSETYNYDIDWDNDGVSDNIGVTGNATHTYSTAGIHTVSISGYFPHIRFINTGDKDKILSVEQWGNIAWTSMESAFAGCHNLVINATDSPDLSNVLTMGSMFQETTSFNQDIGNWDVSNVNNMTGLFYDASAFNQDIGGWDVSNVENMLAMFSGATAFNQNLGNWDISSIVPDIYGMGVMFSGVTLSTANYDAILSGWSSLDAGETQIPTGINFHGGNSQFCAAEFVRANLITDHGWTITDGDIDPSCHIFGLTSTSPVANSVNCTLNSPIILNFNLSFNVGNVSNSTIQVDGSQSGIINGTLTTENAFTITFTPSQSYKPGELITVTITAGLNNNIPITFSFIVGVPVFATPATLSDPKMIISNTAGQATSVVTADLDNDGDLDVVAASLADDKISWYENNGGTIPTFTEHIITITADGVWNVNVADINSDGYMDILAVSVADNATTWYQNDGNTVPTFAKRLLSNARLNPRSIVGGDIDGDGDTDILVASYDHDSITWFVNNGATNPGFGVSTIMNTLDGIRNMTLGDINHDGHLDIITATFNDDTIAWLENDGTVAPTFTKRVVSTAADGAQWVRVGDMDGDGFLDIVSASSSDNKIAWYKNDGAAAPAFTTNVISTTAMAARGVELGDVDGDGDLDIAAVSSDDDTVAWYENNGATTPAFTHNIVNTTADNAFGVALGDLDGNGTLDIISASQTDNTVAWYKTTSQFTDFITRWQTTTANESITITTNAAFTYNYDVDWENDGVFDDLGATGDISHIYPAAGTYTVAIRGSFPHLNQWFSDFAEKLISVEQWGTQEWKSMSNMFTNCSDLSINASDTPNLSMVTNMSSMFRNATSFNSNINHWDVSNVTNMSQMFSGASAYNQPLDSWDVGNVVNMSHMFRYASSFNQDIGSWEVDNVTNMRYMFGSATAFNQNIGGWDMTIGPDVSSMFSGATDFNQDLGNWNMTNITSIAYMFSGATAFNQDISNWDVSNITDMYYAFYRASSFNQDLSDWDVSNVSGMGGMFQEANSFNQDLSNWDVSNVGYMESMFFRNSAFNQNLGNWDISNVLTMSAMFSYASLTTENYDHTLIGWSTLDAGETQIPINVDFDTNSNYCLGEAARNTLINTYNWEINDGGMNCGDCSFTSNYTTAIGWDGGVPNSSTIAVITGNYNTSTIGLGNIEACELIVNAGTELTISEGNYVKVNGNITINGTLTIEHGGSVTQIDDAALVTNNGSIRVEKITPTIAEKAFMIMGSPMTSETREGVYNNSYIVRNHLTGNFVPNPDVELVSPGSNNWADDNGNNWLNHTGLLTPAEGYLVFPQPDGTSSGVFTHNYTQGTLNNGVITMPLLFNTSQNDSPNILANPYASAIDAEVFFDDAANSGIDVLYFWEHITPLSITYPGYNATNFSMADISMYSESLGAGVAAASGGTTPTQFIASGQGFGVKPTAAGIAQFNNAMRITGPNDTYRRPISVERDRLWINVYNDTYGLGSTALIGFTENTSDGFIPSEDVKRLATPVSIYSELDSEEQLAINALSSFEIEDAFYLGFSTQVKEIQDYRISIQDIDGLNLENATVYLIDALTGITTNLSEGDYAFQSGEAKYSKRFKVVFEYGALGINDHAISQISLYPNPTEGQLNIASPNSGINTIMIFDLQGRKVASEAFAGNTNVQIDISNLNAAIYFVDITTDAGTVIKRILKE